MLNKICVDHNFNTGLIVWLQEPRTYDNQWENLIVISIDADATANQYLYVDGREAGTDTITITPNMEQDIEISDELWNMGDISTISLYKNGSQVGPTIYIHFPDVIDSLAMLNPEEGSTSRFVMSGSYNDPSDLAESVADVKDDVTSLNQNKQDKLTAGENITIENNVISATGGGSAGIDYTDQMQDTGLTISFPNTGGGYTTKKLYRITLFGQSLTYNSDKTVDLSSLNIADIINIDATHNYGDGSANRFTLPVPYFISSSNYINIRAHAGYDSTLQSWKVDNLYILTRGVTGTVDLTILCTLAVEPS